MEEVGLAPLVIYTACRPSREPAGYLAVRGAGGGGDEAGETPTKLLFVLGES